MTLTTVRWAAILLFCLSIPVSGFGQINAVAGGTVSDATGALIPGVEVTARNINTGIVTTRITNETGTYEFPSLQPGVYALSAALSGFQTAAYSNVQLSQGQQVRLNFTLNLGAVAQTVEVVAEANTLLATTTASVGDVLPEVEVRSLPLSSRNVLDLYRTAAGSVGENFGGADTTQLNTTRDGLPVMNGRYNATTGVYSAIFTSPDLVEEVQVIANNLDAASGRGSAQVKLQTRAGTNEYHGALFYSNNNSALSSLGFFQNLVGATKSYQNRNQYGGRLGGPIKQNKAFFFVLVDQQRYIAKQNVIATVLTDPARQGIFRYLTANAGGVNGGAARRNGNAFSTTPSVDLAGNVMGVDPATGVPLFMNSFNVFSDVRDPNRPRIDPAWVGPQYLPRMPRPNDWTVGDGLNTAGYRWLRRIDGSDSAEGEDPNSNRDHLTVRLDYQLSSKDRLTYTMSREEDWGVTGQTGLPDFPGGYSGDVRRTPYFYSAAWTSTLSSTLLNEFRWGLKRDTWYGTSPFHRGCCTGGKGEDDVDALSKEALASFPSINGKLFYLQPGLGLGTYAPFSRVAAAPRFNPSPLLQFADSVSWTKGAHSFQGGFEFTRTGSGQTTTGGIATSYPHANLGVGSIPVPGINVTNFRGLQANDVTTAENLLANLAGTIIDISEKFFTNSPDQKNFLDYRDTIFTIRKYRQNDWASFIKDNWKVTSNLTLNIGVRYDKYGIPYDITGMGQRPLGGEAALFGISGKDFNALWNPNATGGSLSRVEAAGKHSPNPDVLAYGNDWNNFGPSMGFSWSLPWFKRSTVLRGGYGVNYGGGLPEYQNYGRQIGAQPGSQIQVLFAPSTYLDVQRVDSRLLPLSTGGARPDDSVPFTNRATAFTAYADKRRIQYSQNYNLSLQRELPRNMTLEVSYIANKGTKLWGSVELNHVNILENGILDAFNVTRAGGNAPLFDRIFMGLNVPGAGVVNGTTLTGSQALRRYANTNQFIANGEAAALANFLNTTSAITNENGGLLRNARLPENFIVVNPQFGSVALHGNPDNSTYHALQTQVNKRLSHGVSGQFSYTWSKSLGMTGVRDPRNLALSKGLGAAHRSHNLKSHGSWTLPFGPGRAFLADSPSLVQRIVEGWDVSGIFSWTSGAPLSFTSSRATITNRGSNTADLVGALPENLGQVRVANGGIVTYFADLATANAPVPDFGGDATVRGRFTNQVVVDNSGRVVLQNPAPGKTGNTAVRRPGLEGPGDLGFDFALSKRVRIGENKSFTIRADAINTLNTPRWGAPNTDINSASFGRITTAGGSRSITINARVDF